MNFSFMNIVESQAMPISSTTPLFSALAGFMLFKERLTPNSVIGAAIIVVGVVLILLAWNLDLRRRNSMDCRGVTQLIIYFMK